MCSKIFGFFNVHFHDVCEIHDIVSSLLPRAMLPLLQTVHTTCSTSHWLNSSALHSLPKFFSFPRTSTQPLMSSSWPFTSLLNQSEDASSSLCRKRLSYNTQTHLHNVEKIIPQQCSCQRKVQMANILMKGCLICKFRFFFLSKRFLKQQK